MPVIIGVNFLPIHALGPDHFWGMVASKHWWTRSPDNILASWRNHQPIPCLLTCWSLHSFSAH